MVSIFEQNEPTSQLEKKLTLGRLQQVLEDPPLATAAEPPKAPPPKSPAPPVPAVADSPRSEGASLELRQFAEQFARVFLESLNHVTRDVQAVLAEDRKRLGAALEELGMNSRETQAVRGDIADLRLKVDALENDRRQLTDRLDQAEQNLSRSSGALRTFEETRSQIEKRLDLQAGAIRSLHDALQSRDENLSKLLSTLQAMQTAAAVATVPTRLSSDL